MKKTLALAIITLATLANTTRAQSPTFEETVKYINKNATQYTTNTGSFTAKKDGTLSYFREDGFKYAEMNVFDINLVYEYDADDGEHNFWWKCKSSGNCIKRFDKEDGSRFSDAMLTGYTSKEGAEKAIKAYNHLRTLCKKEVDPFN